jgi:hypothetical protein
MCCKKANNSEIENQFTYYCDVGYENQFTYVGLCGDIFSKSTLMHRLYNKAHKIKSSRLPKQNISNNSTIHCLLDLTTPTQRKIKMIGTINNNNNNNNVGGGGGGGESRLRIGVTLRNFHCINCVKRFRLCSNTKHSFFSILTRDECDTKRRNYKDDRSILMVNNEADKIPISDLHLATATAVAVAVVIDPAPVPTPATAEATAPATAPTTSAPTTATPAPAPTVKATATATATVSASVATATSSVIDDVDVAILTSQFATMRIPCESEIKQACEKAAMRISRTWDKKQLRIVEAKRALSYDHNLSWELNQLKTLTPMVNTPIYMKVTSGGKRRRTGIV